jgi:riboflavin kinase/FMN adenylyltransferase
MRDTAAGPADPLGGTNDVTRTSGGDVAAAAEAAWVLRGVVVPGARRGRALGYPTANVQTEDVDLPEDGVYAGVLAVAGTRRPAAISVGSNPTFEGECRTVEAYVLDFEGDLYGHVVEVEGHHRLRGMAVFGSVGELLEAMADDVTRTRALMRALPR